MIYLAVFISWASKCCCACSDAPLHLSQALQFRAEGCGDHLRAIKCFIFLLLFYFSPALADVGVYNILERVDLVSSHYV